MYLWITYYYKIFKEVTFMKLKKKNNFSLIIIYITVFIILSISTFTFPYIIESQQVIIIQHRNSLDIDKRFFLNNVLKNQTLLRMLFNHNLLAYDTFDLIQYLPAISKINLRRKILFHITSPIPFITTCSYYNSNCAIIFL